MNHRQIKHTANQLYRRLKKHIKKVARDFDVEAIHQFRVEYKKLRAFFRMLSQEQLTSEKIKITGNFKKAYHLSGSIRDMQLQQQRILDAANQEQKKIQAYFTLLQNSIDKLTAELSEILIHDPLATCKKKTEISIPDEFNISGVKLFIQKKWEVICSIIRARHFSDKNIHAIRKNLKDIFYILEWYKGIVDDFILTDKRKKEEEQYIQILLKELGYYQDMCIAIALLKSYCISQGDNNNSQFLNGIKKDWVKEKMFLKKWLLKKLNTDIL